MINHYTFVDNIVPTEIIGCVKWTYKMIVTSQMEHIRRVAAFHNTAFCYWVILKQIGFLFLMVGG
jgi:hypothetical protein